jgi:hypothetical protein
VGSPSDLVAARRAAWTGRWQQHDDQTALLLVLGALRRRAAREQLRETPLTVEQVATAAQRLPNKPTVWANGWKNSELKDLPTEAMESLTDLLQRVEQHVTVSAQARAAVVSRLPKPGSRGERPICAFPALTQLWGQSRERLTAAWDDKFAGFWGTAVRGRSALQAALMRSLCDEVAVASGYSAASVFFDLEKFCDSVSLGRLCCTAEALKFPALPLLVSSQTFLGRASCGRPDGRNSPSSPRPASGRGVEEPTRLPEFCSTTSCTWRACNVIDCLGC